MTDKIKVADLKVFDMTSFLDSDTAISEYLSQVLEDGDEDEWVRALGYVAKAKGMTSVSRESGPDRENLYTVLSPDAKPAYATIMKALEDLGVRLHAKPV